MSPEDVGFTDEETWLGGFYELAIELGPPSDERLRHALEHVWDAEGIDGPVERYDRAFNAQTPVEPRAGAEDYAHLYGVATLPNGRRVACGTVPVREEEGPDWLVFYIPMGALGLVYDVGAFPFGDTTRSGAWRKPLDAWLAELAGRVFAGVPFPLALVGHEVSGAVNAKEVEASGVPDQRPIGYLVREAERLVWYAPTDD